MTRETRNELLQEFINRDFSDDDILEILTVASMYCDYRKKWLEMPKEYERAKDFYRVRLKSILDVHDLDFAVEDFIDED